MAIIPNPEERYWRTDLGRGRGVYALVSNDVDKPSEYDPLIGTMESMDLAQIVVDVHNAAIRIYGRRFHQRMMELE